jgi:hypothetical protein
MLVDQRCFIPWLPLRVSLIQTVNQRIEHAIINVPCLKAEVCYSEVYEV